MFCTLTYSKEIKNGKLFTSSKHRINFYDYVNFVAIKNGIHDKLGYFYMTDNKLREKYGDVVNLENVRNIIVKELKDLPYDINYIH